MHTPTPSGRGPASAKALCLALCLALTVSACASATGAGPSEQTGGAPSEGAAEEPTGSFAFTRTQPGRPGVPVTYDPCEPIQILAGTALAPPGGMRALRRALRRLHRASGLDLVLLGGAGHLVPLGDRPPVSLAWTTPTETPALRGDVAGFADSSAVTDGRSGLRHYVTGLVRLDAPAIADVLRGPRGEDDAEAIVLHELGHLVGLDHVDDEGELMHRTNVGRTTLGPGDRAGLAALGSGPCLSRGTG